MKVIRSTARQLLLDIGKPQDSHISIFDWPPRDPDSPDHHILQHEGIPPFSVMVRDRRQRGVSNPYLPAGIHVLPLTESFVFQEVENINFFSGSHQPHSLDTDLLLQDHIAEIIPGSRISAKQSRQREDRRTAIVFS